MTDLEHEVSQPAFIGVAFTNKVIFNMVLNDPEFINTGLSIIQQLKHDKNKFVSKIIESQSYDGIKYIFDDKMCFGDFYDIKNENYESYSDIFNLIQKDNVYEYFYIYDLESDTILVKIPEIDNVIALDYNNSSDVREIINKVK